MAADATKIENAAPVTDISTITTTPRPFRVLHLMLEAAWGGLSRYVIDLSNAMALQGVESIVAADDGEWRSKFDGAHLKFVQVPLLREKFFYAQSRAIIHRALDGRPVDLIHTHYRRATRLARKLRLSDLRSHPGLKHPACVPILYTLHLSHINMRFPRNLFTDFGDHTHIASEDARRWCMDVGKVPNDHITCIPHGVDVNRFSFADAATKSIARRSLQLADDDLVAAFVGRLEAPKNEMWLLDLAAASKAQLPKLKILMAGDGPNMPLLRDRIDSENLHDRVRLLGEINPVPLYHAADALLLPSLREGFSLVCAEAMACGVPVLRTKTTGTSETIIENVTGRSTPIDHDAFINAAIEFLSHQDRLHEMGIAAAAHIRRHYTYDQQVKRTLDMYLSLSGYSGRGSNDAN